MKTLNIMTSIRMAFRIMRCVVAAVFLFVAAISSPASAAEAEHPLEKVSVQFHWLHQFEFAGFYVAKEKGYFAEAGLDVTILPYLGGKTDVVDMVTSNKAQYGVSYSSLVFDYFNNQPVVALAAIFQDSPLVLLSRDDDDIKTPADLMGRKVMIGGDALNSAPIMALLFSHGLLRTDIVKQDHSYNVEDLISGRTDAMTSYVSNEPFHMQEHGEGFRIFDPKEAGLSFYGNLLFSSDDEIKNHPERSKAFVQAALKGWAYAFENIDETIRLIQEKYNEQNKSFEALKYEAEALKKLAIKKGLAIGDLDVKKLEKAVDAYRLMGIKMADKSLNEFVWHDARGGGIDALVFSAGERAFIKNTVVKAATTTNWAPFSFVDRNSGKPIGIGRDFWQEIVKAAHLESEITSFESFLNELKSIREKEQDVIYSVGITKERQSYALFSEPYASFPLAIATSKDENFIPSPEQLIGKKIAIGRNFTAHKMMLKAFPDFDYQPVGNVKEGLQAVSSGDAYAFIDIMPVLAHTINLHGFTNLKISGDTGLVFDLRIMVRDDYPELVSIINKVISALSPEQKQQIMNRWFNVQYQSGYDIRKHLPYVVAFLFLATLLVFWLYQSKLQAQRANRAKSEFLALMSHDLRTPLNAIMGFSDMIRNKAFGPLGDPKYEEYAADIHKSGALLVNLINDILDLSKIEAGKYELSEEKVDVSELVSSSINQCSVLAGPAEVRIVNQAQDTLPALLGDERVMIQILNNILSNAIKFSHDGGRVEISATVNRKGGIEIEVRDTGIGMSKEEIFRVLKPFEQSRKDKVRRNEGTGLGLYLCQSLMDLFSGDLIINSEVNIGTTVILRFPSERTMVS